MLDLSLLALFEVAQLGVCKAQDFHLLFLLPKYTFDLPIS